MYWPPFSIGGFHSNLRALLLLFCVCAALRGITAASECSRSTQLNVYTATVEEKGYRFEKLEVNRSHPVHVTYRVVSNNLEVDSVEWKHNGEEIHLEKNPKLSLHYTVDHTDTDLIVTLNVTSPIARSTGAWTVIVKTTDGKEHSAVCYISSPPILRRMIGAVRTNVGSPLSVECPLDSATPNAIVTWKRVTDGPNGQKVLKPVDDVTFKPEGGVNNAVMEWANATEAAGLYLCSASTYLGTDNTLIEVRIKDYKTYLWPSIGILLEIILLAITIAAYEISRSKKRKAEEAGTNK